MMTMAAIGEIFQTLKDAAKDFGEDGGPNMAAAIAYYTVFSLPPVLVLILMLAGIFVDPATVQEMIQGEFSGMLGDDGASAIAEMIQNARQPGSGGAATTVLGIGALLLGAAGAFSALQAALNRAWEVMPDPNLGGIKAFLSKRIFSYGMVLGLAFLLLVSLGVSALLTAFGDALGGFLPGGADAVFAQIMNEMISLAVITVLFAAIFKVMPDAQIDWQDVRVGAFVTAILFIIGKFAIGLYLGRSDPGSAFGAAGSLAVILVWVYYSAMIVIFGAEFTQSWAKRFGKGIVPEPGAVRVIEVQERSSGSSGKKRASGKAGGREKETVRGTKTAPDASPRSKRDEPGPPHIGKAQNRVKKW